MGKNRAVATVRRRDGGALTCGTDGVIPGERVSSAWFLFALLDSPHD